MFAFPKWREVEGWTREGDFVRSWVDLQRSIEEEGCKLQERRQTIDFSMRQTKSNQNHPIILNVKGFQTLRVSAAYVPMCFTGSEVFLSST